MAYGTIKVDTITFTDGGVDKSVSISGLVENPTFTGNVTATGTISGDILRGQTISGVTVTGTTAQFTSGTFTSLTGVTVTGTTANFTSGNFTNISGGTHTITSGVFAAGSAANPSITFTGDLNTGIYSPGADQVAISTNGTERVLIKNSSQDTVRVSGTNAVITADATSSSYPGFRLAQNGSTFAGLDGDAGNSVNLYTFSALPLRFGINGTERMRLDSSGRLGLGTSSVGTSFHAVGGNVWSSNFYEIGRFQKSSGTGVSIGYDNTAYVASIGAYSHDGTASALSFWTYPGSGIAQERVRITPGGAVGIGTAAPGSLLHAAGKIRFGSNASYYGEIDHDAGGTGSNIYDHSDGGGHIFRKNGNEQLRIDSSGRLLVGTSGARGNLYGGYTARTQIEGTDFETAAISVTCNNATDINSAVISLNKSGGTSIGSNTIVSAGERLGSLRFQGNDGTNFIDGAYVLAEVDGTPGTNDMPTRLVFSTTADGASSPTERMRIDNAGSLIYGTNTSPGADITSGTGFYYQISTGLFYIRSNGAPAAAFNRGGDDGTLVEFKQDQITEGTISVSGTTVSYNGAHLSRWSQLPGGAVREEILRGTVLSNIDEMCDWGEEDNEQLNRMKVSDVEGDSNVSGVFQGWDDDDDTYTNDFYCAMTGDFIIRIAEGVTVQRGDLLMSAGDGTAKPQDDDIIRSKTIAKVTSTHVTCTYDDDSYCVPCVLMAC